MAKHLLGPVGPVDSRGVAYETYVIGVKQEGEAPPLSADSAKAWGAFIEAVSLAISAADVVEWRMVPTEETDARGCYVRARLSAYGLP